MILFTKIYVLAALIISFVLLVKTLFIIDRNYFLRIFTMFMLTSFTTIVIINLDKFNVMDKIHRNILIFISLMIFICAHRIYYNLIDILRDIEDNDNEEE